MDIDLGKIPVPEDVVAARNEFFDVFSRLISNEGEKFSRLVCCGVLAEPDTLDMPFSASGDDIYQLRARERYSYLAGLILKKMDGKKSIEPGSTHATLAQWIEDRAYFDTQHHSIWDYERYGADKTKGVRDVDSFIRRPDFLWSCFFKWPAQGLGEAFAMATELIYHGLPLFTVSPDGSYVRVNESDEDYVYLRLRGKYLDLTDEQLMPEIAHKYSINLEHVRWHDILFSSNDSFSEEEVRDRRDAFRRQIGDDVASAAPVQASVVERVVSIDNANQAVVGRLNRYVEEVGRQFWGTFDSEAVGARPPTQTEIITWLETTYNLSQADAKAVEKVACPFDRNPKKHS